MRSPRASLLVGLVLLACGEGGPARPPRVKRGPVVAEVNGVAIHREEVEARMRHDGLSAREALDRIVDEELTIEAARQLGLSPARDLAFTRQRAQVQALLAREVESKVRPSDFGPTDIAAAWETGRQLEADHLLVKTARQAAAAERARARAFAAEVGVAARRTASREDFVALASSMRADGVTLVTEDLGRFRRDGRFVRPFEDRVFRMSREGEISEPFETEFGWHVVRLRKVGNTFGESLETARDDVVEALVVQRRRALYEALVERLQGAAHVEIDPTALTLLDAPPP